MLKPSKQCKVCKFIADKGKLGKKLEKDIYSSVFFIKTSSRTILDIHRDYEEHFSYKSIRVHAATHQTLSPTQLHNRNQRAIAKQKQQQQAIQNTKAGSVWDAVIKTGMAKLQAGELEMRTADLLKATKDKSDYELKVKDQEMQMAEMVAYFASGEGDNIESRKYDRRIIEGEAVEDFDPTTELTADIERRTEQSRAVYQRIVRDAPTPGTD